MDSLEGRKGTGSSSNICNVILKSEVVADGN